MSTAPFLSALIALLVIVNPIALAPIFISLTQLDTAEQKRVVARLATIIAVGILLFFFFFGKEILALIGITMAAFRISGGLLLFAVAFEMLFDKRSQRDSGDAHTAKNTDNIKNVAAFPLAIPLIAGPGAITTVILFSGHATAESDIGYVAAILLVGLICLGVFALSAPLARLLGQTGIMIMMRLMGVLLAAMAVQFIITGVQTIK